MRLANCLMMFLVLFAGVFALSACDDCDKDGGSAFWTKTEMVDEVTFCPSVKVLQFFPWPPHFVWVISECDLDEIECKLGSDADWRVVGQDNDGYTGPSHQIDQFHFHMRGYTIDIREEVTLQLFESHKVRKAQYYWRPFTREEIEEMQANGEYDVDDPSDQGEWVQYPDWEPRS